MATVVATTRTTSVGSPGSALGFSASSPTLLSVLGADGLAAAVPDAGAGALHGAAQQVLAQVLKVVAALQGRLQESESTIHELQAHLDEVTEKVRPLQRRAERAERERDTAVRRAVETEAKAKAAKAEAVPLVQQHMEAEVLRHQLQVLEDELPRLREDCSVCRQELERGWPRLADAEDAEAQCGEAIAELETAHAEEVAILRSMHLEELSDMRARHAAGIGEIEAARREEVSSLKAQIAEECGNLTTSREAALWQADVYVREQQDAVREVCLRQRENARLAKRHGEARQEALELSVKLEALRAASTGAPAREAELNAVRQRCHLLQRTVAEWREALERKQLDCEVWRRRAVQRGATLPEEEDAMLGEAPLPRSPPAETRLEVTSRVPAVAAVPLRSASATTLGSRAHHHYMESGSLLRQRPRAVGQHSGQMEVLALDVSHGASTPGHITPMAPASPSAPPSLILGGGYGAGEEDHYGYYGANRTACGGNGVAAMSPLTWSGVPTPARTPHRMPGGGRPLSPQQWKQHSRLASVSHAVGGPPGNIAGRPAAGAPPPLPSGARTAASGPSPVVLQLPPPSSADEFLAVALRTAKLQVDAAPRKQPPAASEGAEGGEADEDDGDPAEEPAEADDKVTAAVQEAENDLDMQMFLLSEADATEAENLLEQEVRHCTGGRELQERLEAQLEKLRGRSSRGHHGGSPHSSADVAGAASQVE
eukprot:TRINITY_DN36068_c0_g1_i1.p1 TRINITY_DN36068_c0_g1~~TRINITY_DN36068_c0_g1_i1.p1  ORF type:complete len:715 (+),score=182.11 TRINITY_DN36068_c0_g1_i1:112-2256(+)